MTEHRVAVVTGAGTGIGQAMAVKFASLGWSVAIGGRRVEKLQETAQLVREAGGTPFAGALDVSSPASVDEFFAGAEAALGPVSVAINNAAVARYGDMDDFSPEEIAAEVNTKLLGSLYVARRAIQTMRQQEDGVADIVFVTSLAAHAARILKQELEGTGIRVSTFRCGETVGTDFATKEMETGRVFTSSELWFRRGLLRHTGAMTPDMVADAVAHMVTLPPGCQFELVQMVPTAPRGPVPETMEELAALFEQLQ
jgi:NADP-dependent 3-hydroxy acid dehydrogenase YdfG